jgi:competence protein ComFC
MPRKTSFKSILRSLTHLVYPSQCVVCSEEILNEYETAICPFCNEALIYTQFEKYTEATSLDKLFWGKISVVSTFALLYFEKGKSTQQILHSLKYHFNAKIGIEFGKRIGIQLKMMEAFNDVDAIIPVPIHPKKEFKRGYNQSEQLAIGLAEILNIPVKTDFIQKNKNTVSQTKLNKFDRWDNVSGKFHANSSKNQFKHVTIIDDVITTGSTIESLIRSIHDYYPEIRISVVSLAFAK